MGPLVTSTPSYLQINEETGSMFKVKTDSESPTSDMTGRASDSLCTGPGDDSLKNSEFGPNFAIGPYWVFPKRHFMDVEFHCY